MGKFRLGGFVIFYRVLDVRSFKYVNALAGDIPALGSSGAVSTFPIDLLMRIGESFRGLRVVLVGEGVGRQGIVDNRCGAWLLAVVYDLCVWLVDATV